MDDWFIVKEPCVAFFERVQNNNSFNINVVLMKQGEVFLKLEKVIASRVLTEESFSCLTVDGIVEIAKEQILNYCKKI